MNVGWMLQPGETGIDPDWAKKDIDQVIGDEASFWLSEITMHTKAPDIARGIVESSRKRP